LILFIPVTKNSSGSWVGFERVQDVVFDSVGVVVVLLDAVQPWVDWDGIRQQFQGDQLKVVVEQSDVTLCKRGTDSGQQINQVVIALGLKKEIIISMQ